MASATVKARIRFTDAADLLISTDSGLASPTTVAGVEGEDDIFTFTLTGLADNTQYYYGFDGLALTGSFKTWPAEGSQASFTVVASGDSGLSPQYPGSTSVVANAPTWDRMAEHDPLFAIVLGDWHYSNLNTTNAASYRTAYKRVLGESRVADFVCSIPTDYLWDDHDFGPNDSNGTYTGKATAQQVYREYVPHWTLPESDSIHHTYVVGRVRFIHLDSRSGRSPNGNTDNSSKTRLGATQKQWLKDTLDESDEPVVVLNVMSWIGGTTGFSDGWDSFNTERTELFDYFEANGHMDRLFLIGADIHELMADDGTNTNMGTSGDPGPPYVGFAPIDASFNDFSATAQDKYQTRRQQYGTLEFTDAGTSITVTAKGWALSASPGSTSSEVFSISKEFAADAPEPEPEPEPEPPAGGGGSARRASIFVQPPAKVTEVTDDGWIHIVL